MTVDNYIKLHLTITISSFFTQKGGIAQLNFQCKTNNLQVLQKQDESNGNNNDRQLTYPFEPLTQVNNK